MWRRWCTGILKGGTGILKEEGGGGTKELPVF